MTELFDLLVVGAGPNGLATAAYARSRGRSCRVVGEAMGFWKHNMPPGMLLRSGVDWHLDPLGVHTFEAYLRSRSLDPATIGPIPVQLFLDYGCWFQAQTGLDVVPDFVVDLRHDGDLFRATLARGENVSARNVVIATGSKAFKHVPQHLVAGLPADCFAHTCDLVDFAPLKGRRCLVVGDRQSAFEWAALINGESGCEVHVIFRHDMPRFAPIDWSWIDSHIAETLDSPGWYRKLTEYERSAVDQHFWEEAKEKLDPWLWDRLGADTILSWPHRSITRCTLSEHCDIQVMLDNELCLHVDFMVLATGYIVDITRLRFLSDPSVSAHVTTEGGYPVLDEAFQSTLPGLYFTGMAAMRDFGPMFAFVRGCTVTARLIVDSLV
jgi:hypothetical protein